MISNLLELLVNNTVQVLIGLILASVITIIGKKSYEYFWFIKPVRKIFPIKKGDVICIVTGKVDLPNVSETLQKYYVLGTGDFKAVVNMCMSLENKFDDIKIRNYFSREIHGQIIRDENIITIGGPMRNSVTRYLLESGVKKYGFKFDNNDGHLIIIKNNKEIHKRPKEKNGFFEIDYGIIIKDRHPSNENKFIFIFAGCHTEGVQGSVEYLLTTTSRGLSNIRALSKKLGKRKYFAFAVEVKPYQDESGEIEIFETNMLEDTLKIW